MSPEPRDASGSATGPRASDRRLRPVFWLATVLLVLAAMEFLSLVTYRLVEGRFFSYRKLRLEQQHRRSAALAGDRLPERSELPHEFLRETVLHPYLGFVGNPEFDPGYSPWGFWGNLGEPPPRRDPSRLLIAIFGGSLAGGFHYQAGEYFKELLGRGDEREIVFMNAACGGYKQPQQLMALAYLLTLGGELDVVINLDGFNEVALDGPENAAQGVFPAYPRSWALRVNDFRDPAVVARVGELGFYRRRRAALAEAFSAAPWRYSITAGLWWTLLDRWTADRLAAAEAGLNAYRPPGRRFLATGPPRPATEAAVTEELAVLWQRGSLQLDRLCRANGIRYYHFLQPNQYLEGSKPMGRRERSVAVDPSHPYRPGVLRGYPLLRRKGLELQAHGVAFFDLTQLFAEVEEPLYSDSCCHLNRRGYGMLADAVAAAILADRASPPVGDKMKPAAPGAAGS